MSRPPAVDSPAGPLGWRRPVGRARGRSRGWTGSLRPLELAATAAAVLAACVSGAVGLRAAPGAIDGLATSSIGTAFLGTATCADWRREGVTRRTATIAALGVAATGPDPENRGATMDEGAAYGLFQRVCSTRASQPGLLYEIYNRAASFQPAATAPIVRPGGFGTAPHR